ncbi:conserved Plasmodium protein, unknown function [Plasmodium knowlesi strain H]|uniref:Uncharacterized protein n=3 Tax=Plasmodium knowlesi TaxID=5850 RepID=A0A5K1VD45_PLAKH|nr:conserved Plasmodium protein, unknown function [Plasmodium knowlesi strain H]OTN65429.1 Uncharacterized protein PKNOH_S110078000 [Plasmodium knowlesi]CAA9989401.1 conserved Plasmodium protein, unknown function [Plasmodium knowlesi strain H]SBO25002.1 conserved Plasmodium protein, unknown function [Plasmodium knowlesi strain H]SBO27871.1 conserved Plasmodium protein, unknown function [Plasmodium knowlesi strain H]VVS78875.1 conserved Plasmodium protein, unknown function [Plasmodium knowlesi |eukprot:XP_002260128.1 hypothetical protein, conserved in Plasmodium species [Plasmodium knowlesi strain H]
MLNNNGFNGGVNQMNEYQGGMNFQGNGPFPGGGQFQANNNSEQRQQHYGELQNCNNDFYAVQKINGLSNHQGFVDRNVMYGNNSFGRPPPPPMEEIPNYYQAKAAMSANPMGGISMSPTDNGFPMYQNKNSNQPFFAKEQSPPNYNDQALFSQVKQNVSIFGNKAKNNAPLFANNVKSQMKVDVPSVSLYDFVSHDKSIFGNRLKEGKPLFANTSNMNQTMENPQSVQQSNNYLQNNNHVHSMPGHGGDKNYMNYNYDAKGQTTFGMNPSNYMMPPSMGGMNNVNEMGHHGNQLMGNTYNQNNLGANMGSVPSAQNAYGIAGSNAFGASNFSYPQSCNALQPNMQNEQYPPMFGNGGAGGINTFSNSAYGNQIVGANNMSSYPNLLSSGGFHPSVGNSNVCGGPTAATTQMEMQNVNFSNNDPNYNANSSVSMQNNSTQNAGKEQNCQNELQGEEVLFTNENEILFEKNYIKKYGMEGDSQMDKIKKILFFNKNFVKSLEQIASHNLNSYNENRSTIYTFPCSMASNNINFYMQAVEDCKKESRFDVDADLYNKIFTKQNMQQAFSVLKNINMNKKMDQQDIDLDIYYPLLHVEKIKFRQPVTPEHSRTIPGAPFQLGQIPTVI